MDIVSSMNAVFSCFDSLMDEFNVYKVSFICNLSIPLHYCQNKNKIKIHARTECTDSFIDVSTQDILPSRLSTGRNSRPGLYGSQWCAG